MLPTIEWRDGAVVMVDQRKLPGQEVYVHARTYEEVAEAIETMVIRGAPAIGVAAAMGVALGADKLADDLDASVAREAYEKIHARLHRTRPTAVNLFWALKRMRAVFEESIAGGRGEVRRRLIAEAIAIEREDIEQCRSIGRHGCGLIPKGATVLTHCNAGALATAGYGTALGVIRAAHEADPSVTVFADETRPFLQGARLTAWELMKDSIPVTLITDNMAGSMMNRGRINCVVVGADRIAANGDTANKIGTYSVAVLARENGIPFYVAAPASTFDLSLSSGAEIPIEERASAEVTEVQGVKVAPDGVAVCNPAFDVTPARYVTAFITDRGVARPPFAESLLAIR
ncbi:MAG: S-methyl-5-thioribose-1-phosphate isomerase [Acidobacteria bacterium]|nr:S-methyl-5-thioribose-1-phosphate isomerase [Acidobacteriota bacterium]